MIPLASRSPTWQAEFSAVDLLKALHAAGVRGDALRDLEVQTNAGGRVTAITLTGLTPSTLAADDFRRIIGQHLGWQWLKSLRFTAQRTARGYRFTGRGHGHGVGLCMLGASALATRGQSAADLLRAYFPGLHVRLAPAAPATVPKGHPPSLAASEAASANRAASHAASTLIDVRLPAAQEAERASLKSQLARDLRALGRDTRRGFLTRAFVADRPSHRQQFPSRDRPPWWASAATMFADRDSHATIHVVPLEGLRRSGRLDSMLRHEVVHVVTAPQLRGKPMWVRRGLPRISPASSRLAASSATPLVCPTDADFARAKPRRTFRRRMPAPGPASPIKSRAGRAGTRSSNRRGCVCVVSSELYRALGGTIRRVVALRRPQHQRPAEVREQADKSQLEAVEQHFHDIGRNRRRPPVETYCHGSQINAAIDTPMITSETGDSARSSQRGRKSRRSHPSSPPPAARRPATRQART